MFYKIFLLIFLSINIVLNCKPVFALESVYEKEYEEYDEYDDYAEEYSGTKKQVNDPFEKVNRKIFNFNYYLMKSFLIPAGNMYRKITNQFIRDRIDNVFLTIKEPLVTINSILELDYKNTLKSLATIGTNLTVGCLGLFNPAKYTSFYRENRTFDDTLKFYGVSEGPYLMLPFLGPYTLRDSIGYVGGFFVNPVTMNSFEIFTHDPWIKSLELKSSLYGANALSTAIKLDSLNNSFLKKSFDPYIVVRDFYYNKS